MRGDEQRQEELIMLTSLEDVVPSDHPLRAIRAMVDAALAEMSPTLEALYAGRGRPSIAPEVLLRAQLIQILYAIPSERRLVEHLEYNLLLRSLRGPAALAAGLSPDELQQEPPASAHERSGRSLLRRHPRAGRGA